MLMARVVFIVIIQSYHMVVIIGHWPPMKLMTMAYSMRVEIRAQLAYLFEGETTRWW